MTENWSSEMARIANTEIPDFTGKSDTEIDTWIQNHEKRQLTDVPLYFALLEERARRSSHQLNVDKTLKHLHDCAKRREFTTYGAVAEVNGVEWTVAYRQMGKHLDRGLEVCHARKWPLLTAICVKQNEVLTGALSGDSLKGFIAGVHRLGYSVTDPEAYLRQCQEACFKWAETN